MLNVGPGELLAIMAIALIVLGPDKLPQALRTAGRVMGELRRISSGFQDEIRNALEDSEAEQDIERLRNAQRPELPPLDPAAEVEVTDRATDDDEAPVVADDKDPAIDDEDGPVELPPAPPSDQPVVGATEPPGQVIDATEAATPEATTPEGDSTASAGTPDGNGNGSGDSEGGGDGAEPVVDTEDEALGISPHVMPSDADDQPPSDDERAAS
jgi:sec-independent protein translocase protein TatB